MTAAEIEVAVAKHIGTTQNIVVPNVSLILGLTCECDILYVTRSGYAHEVEIKVSKADLIRDKNKKRHLPYFKRDTDRLIRSRTFAIPKDMEDCIKYIPETNGVMLVYPPSLYCRVLRKPQINKSALKLTDKEIISLGRLAAQKIWLAKKKLLRGKP